MILFFLALHLGLKAGAAQSSPAVELPPIEVGSGPSPFRKSEGPREVLSSPRAHSSKSLPELLNQASGVEAQTACAFCGSQRLSIQGMKGEHTTLLVDGLPLLTPLASFYGAEALSIGILDDIQVHRGAGAAGTAPDSMAGVLRLQSRDPFEEKTEMDFTLGVPASGGAAFSTAQKLADNWALLGGAEASERPDWDRDQNQITEMPLGRKASAFLKLGRRDSSGDVSFRIQKQTLQTLGGHRHRTPLSQPLGAIATSDDFVNRDVRQLYIGDPLKVADHIRVDRTEAAVHALRFLSTGRTLEFAAGGAIQKQEAVYSHGYDYRPAETVTALRGELQSPEAQALRWALGVDHRAQSLRSESQILFQQQGLPKDDLNFSGSGIFASGFWDANDLLKVQAHLRVERLRVQWHNLRRDLQEDIASPRLQLESSLSEVMKLRLWCGLGSRMPLTMFESQHGNDHYGFELALRGIERAKNVGLSLEAQWLDSFLQGSVQSSEIEGLVYGLDRAENQDSTLFLNSDENFRLYFGEVRAGHRWSDGLEGEILLEKFWLPTGYKAKLPVAAQEELVTLSLSYRPSLWSLKTTAQWVGSRDLGAYGYHRHYNVAFKDEDVLSPTFGQVLVSDQKLQRSPSYWTVDIEAERAWGKFLHFQFGVRNLFDFTQASVGDTPLTWDLHGDHFHLDNFHLWGPNRGREVYVGVRATW